MTETIPFGQLFSSATNPHGLFFDHPNYNYYFFFPSFPLPSPLSLSLALSLASLCLSSLFLFSFQAAASGFVEAIEVLIDFSADVAVTDNKGT